MEEVVALASPRLEALLLVAQVAPRKACAAWQCMGLAQAQTLACTGLVQAQTLACMGLAQAQPLACKEGVASSVEEQRTTAAPAGQQRLESGRPRRRGSLRRCTGLCP